MSFLMKNEPGTVLGAKLASVPRMNPDANVETDRTPPRRVNIQLVGEDAVKFEEFMQSRGIKKNAKAASALVEEAAANRRNRKLVVEIPEEIAEWVRSLMQQERYESNQESEFVTNVIRSYWREWGEPRLAVRRRVFGPERESDPRGAN